LEIVMRERHPGRIERELVLVGGGHAHVQVLRRWMMKPLPGVRLSVVLDRSDALYSGMVPGVVSGDYTIDEATIDVVPLARRAGARCILAAATRVDPVARQIEVEGRPPIRYDVASLDVGSTVRDLDLPGVREHALATRPIGRFVGAIEAALAASAQAPGPLRISVVGGGAAGVELSLCIEARLGAARRACEVTLLSASNALLPGGPPALARRARDEAKRRGIAMRCGVSVEAVEADAVVLAASSDGARERIPSDLVVWATGAAAYSFLRDSPLATDEQGFVRVRATLQVEGNDDLFAVGDCAALIGHPWVPRAGVYAVREGPVLDHNLRGRLDSGALRSYRPQRDFLALLNLGGRRAVGGKWGRSFQGHRVWQLKDWIDRRFMRRFQVLDADGGPARFFPSPEQMASGGDDEMACGGCAAKLGPTPLRDALARLPAPFPDDSVRLGICDGDDAAAFETEKGDLLLASVDAFRAFSDDPFLVGRVAAVNAVSDIQAKGGRPRHALALVSVPDDGGERSAETLYQVLEGVRAALDPLGVTLVGGHSTLGPELFVGLSISGDVPGDAGWLGLDGLEPGDALVLTKPIGTGLLLAADMRGLATGSWVAAVTASMLRDNGGAARAARASRAHACTDVSGFGLAGHLLEMLRASDVRAHLDLDAIPVLPGAATLLESGLRSTYHEQNAALRRELEGAMGDRRRELVFDPQTSGGLLIGVAAPAAEALVTTLREGGDIHAAVVGQVSERSDKGGRWLSC
jgi:selenide,water dikinase